MSRSTRARGGLLSLSLLALVGLAACGGSGGAATSGPGGQATTVATTDPGGGEDGLEGEAGLCGVFPAALAEAALGESVGEPVPNRGTIGGLTYFCRYTGTSGAVLDIEYSPDKTRATWDAEMAAVEMTGETAVSGIGDAAWLADDSGLGPGSRLSAYANGGSIWVTIAKDGDAATLQAAAQQAAKALLAALSAQG